MAGTDAIAAALRELSETRQDALRTVCLAILSEKREHGLTWSEVTILAAGAMDGDRTLPIQSDLATFVATVEGRWEAAHLAIWLARKIETARESEQGEGDNDDDDDR